jgi:pimeloyl-ACP methyl ester carboxylesterase
MEKVISKDGTPIAYEKTGSGPAVILVDGAFCSRNFGPMPKLTPLLAAHFTVFTYDRRARGDSGDNRTRGGSGDSHARGGSGDSKPYDVRREIEDLDALIKVAGGSTCLFGISSGAILALLAAASGLRVTKLALFEPPFVGDRQGRMPKNPAEELQRLIAEEKKGEAVIYYLRRIMGLPVIITFILRLTPNWPKMKANANSLPYDAAICGDFQVPKEQAGSVLIPTLVIDSEKSPKMLRDAVATVTAILPNANRKTLKGKVHDVPPAILAPVLKDFYI